MSWVWLFLRNLIKACQNLFFGSFYSYAMVALVFLKKFVKKTQLELGKTKIHSQFLILLLHCWCNKKL